MFLHTIVYCKAVRPAILATAWLLVLHDTSVQYYRGIYRPSWAYLCRWL